MELTIDAERDALLAAEKAVSVPVAAPAAMLLGIRGVGPEFAAILWSEGLFRHLDHRRHAAAYAGLAPSPWQSGDREQGVSKAGKPRLRTTAVQLSWLWLRHQPKSALAQIRHCCAGSKVAGRALEV